MTSTSKPQRPRAQRGGIEDRWHKKAKDELGQTIEVPSSNYGKVTRWRTRYVDNAGCQHTKHFERKAVVQNWLKASMAVGDHVGPKTSRLTVGEVRQLARRLPHSAQVDGEAGRGAHQAHQGALRSGAAGVGEAFGREGLDVQAATLRRHDRAGRGALSGGA